MNVYVNKFLGERIIIFHKKFSIILLLLLAQYVGAQTEHSALLEGNQAYQDGNFRTAITHFQQAIDKNKESLKGHYNLGNALYKNKQYESAITHFQQAAEQADNDQHKAQALYNLGNSYLAQAQAEKTPNKKSKTQLEAAIGAYKSALRNNPRDFEAKNNLATAYKLLRQQQPPQNKQNQQNKQDNQKNQQDNQQDRSSENEDQQKQQQQQGQEEEQKPPNQKQEQPIDNTNEPQPRDAKPQELSKAEAKRLLQVVAEDDKDVQERLMQRQQKTPQKGDKSW